MQSHFNNCEYRRFRQKPTIKGERHNSRPWFFSFHYSNSNLVPWKASRCLGKVRLPLIHIGGLPRSRKPHENHYRWCFNHRFYDVNHWFSKINPNLNCWMGWKLICLKTPFWKLLKKPLKSTIGITFWALTEKTNNNNSTTRTFFIPRIYRNFRHISPACCLAKQTFQSSQEFNT